MAASIDVVFTGLMLICLDGQSNCPQYTADYPNTAWAVKADVTVKPCGWVDYTVTTLELQFDTDELTYDTTASWPSRYCTPDSTDATKVTCTPLEGKDLCVYPKPTTQEQRLEASLKLLPRLDEVDRRFKGFGKNYLENPDYVPTRIHFTAGVIGAGEKWPPRSANAGEPRLWHRSDGRLGGALPRNLSDRLRVNYEDALTLTLKECGGAELIVLTRKVYTAQATLRNSGFPLNADPRGSFENLSYLLWYYRLGVWDAASESCPKYVEGNKDATLLRCRGGNDTRCSCTNKKCDRDTIFWPPMLVTQILEKRVSSQTSSGAAEVFSPTVTSNTCW